MKVFNGKQAANDYPFVYQDTMENLLSDDLSKSLGSYEEKLLNNISKKGELYNILKKSNKYRRPESYKDFYSFDTSNLEDILIDNYVYAYRSGGQQAYKDFNQDKEFKLKFNDLTFITASIQLNISNINKSYSNLIVSKLIKSFKGNKSFSEFFDDLSGYKDFKKSADESYVPPMPNKQNIIENFKTREISRHVNEGRFSGYNNTGRIINYIYKTRADERVSTICAPWHNQVLLPDKIRGVLPQHRNCRCTIVPFECLS